MAVPADRELPRTAPVALTVGVWVGLLAAMLPLLSVIVPGGWIAGVVIVTAAVLGAGLVARWYRFPAYAIALIETAVWIMLITVIFLREAAIVFIIPTLRAFGATPDMVGTALHEIQIGVSPLAASTALSFCIVTAAGTIAVVVDHIAITARMPLAAAVALVAVSLIPSIAVASPFDVISFVVLAAAILFLLRTETRTRYHPPRTAPSGPRTTSAIALAIGLVAVLVAVVATPLLPEPPARAGAGVGGTSINANLDLGRNLREPNPVTVLTVQTSAPSAPYLRVATLSAFGQRVWTPDVTPAVPVGDGAGFIGTPTDPDITVQKVTTDIHIDSLSARFLPIPFPATRVTGLPSGWEAMSANHTIIANGVLTHGGMEYQVTTEVPQPTLEQIRASDARGGDPAAMGARGRVPAIITEDARRVTTGTDDDYDALIALQSWFRGSEFTYSLTAPVTDGYDGSGMAEIAAFLKQKAGYCIHFATAFTVMARVLGMTARVVVGYLPGTANTSQLSSGKQLEYDVSSTQLHAWSEVYFEGIGWVAFDPTKSLGQPTGFLSAQEAAGGGSTDPSAPSATPSTTPTDTARDPNAPNPEDAQAGGAGATSVNLLPWGLGAGGIVVVLLVPMLIAALRRRRQDAAARAGDPLAAWSSVRDVAIDLGIPVPVSESPRAFGARLVHDHGSPQRETALLVDAVETAAYSPGDGGTPPRASADAAAAVRTGLYLGVSKRQRARALLLPRSLIVRPGSAFARAGASTSTR
ncbi:DUF3488 and transglutaminase-like domain-containing protein [Microbacterium kribbense]|uniref:DUF3488 and transglutaminase-like domain-containing protein n=1 Tax=Microbacterium kribbense TaxID=433645 RepID=A0ABP7GAM5_9MICO